MQRGRGGGGIGRGGGGRGRGRDVRNQDPQRRGDRVPYNARDGNGQNAAAAAPPRQYHIGYMKLKEMTEQDPKDALIHLNNSNNNFLKLLDDDETMNKPDFVEMIMKLLLNCSEERTMPEVLTSVLNILMKSKFLTNFSNVMILDMVRETRRDKQEQLNRILKNGLNLVEKLMLRSPANAFPIAFQMTSNLERLIPILRRTTVIMDDENVSLVTSLKESTDYHLIHAAPKTEEHTSPHDQMAPPDDFRLLPTIPTKNDLHVKEEPFLRVNKINGSYNDVDHYLDVQYRLLREDFIAPLREGIEEYLQRGQRRRKLNSVILYENVRFVKPECSSAGIVYVLQLDMNTLSRIRWQSSKRLIFGSLVCLSRNNFETFIVATVHERKVEILESKGQVSVQLPDLADIRGTFDESYVMLETTAYFESYRHVLEGLQEIGQNMVFKEHIVFCSADVAAPNYLTRKENVQIDFTTIFPDDATERMKTAFKSVPARDLQLWPQAEHLGLDLSQWRALVNAITKRLSIIQGPPGTGKTFIGLKVAKLLLTNYEIWADDGEAMRPILVVCYTNHALDQFLEGILKFSDANEIVRVGGRSKSVELEACMLKTLRRNVDRRAEHVRGAFQALRDNTGQLREAEDQINILAKQTESAQQKILTSMAFEEYMTDEQKTHLGFNYNSGVDPMKEWLGFAGRDLRGILRMASADEEQGPDEDEPEIIEEAEAVEAERALEIDDEWAEILGTHETVHDDDDDNDWGELTRNEKRTLRRKLGQKLNDPDTMTEDVAERTRDPWQLSEFHRWRLYRYWVKCYLAALNENVNEQHANYMNLVRIRNEINNDKDANIMRHAKIIGMTTTGCARYRQILARIKPKIVIVEEAAEVLEAHIITALSEGCEHLIMIGDHKQLRPNPAVYRLARKFCLDVSLFERMIRNKLPFECLRIQHRMRPEISDPMRFIYPELQDAEDVKKRDDILGVSTNMFYIDHGYPETSDSETRSHSNRHEAEFTIQLCRYLLQQGYEPSQVTILTPYFGQLLQFKNYIASKHIRELKDVRLTVVDNFQGEENDIILLSLVRSNTDGNIGFLGVDNRVCVALSRARKGLFVIGNIQLLKTKTDKTDLWEKLEDHMRKQGRIGEHLQLKCQVHYMDEGVKVAKAGDFDKVSEGGCSKMCEFRLQCGHTCPRQCHIYDRDHIDMTQRCVQPCARNPCGNQNHRCKRKCNQDCGICDFPTEKILPRCGHTQAVKCGENLDLVVCKKPCPYKLQCGHPCKAGCSRPCAAEPCREPVPKTLQCGHTQTVPCFKPMSEAVCREKCYRKLLCEHDCAGTCQLCYGGHLHRNCTSKCERRLVCGHLCKEPCTKDCPPCSEKCQNRCVHSKCQKKCGEECVKCKEQCEWRCAHKRCSKLCYEQCDRDRCDEPCRRLVPEVRRGKRAPVSCKHPCIGLCGEPCPKLCRICDQATVQQILFGDEDEPNTRFVELSDCGHIFSAPGLDQWMDQLGDNTIQVKRCPKCNVEVRQHLRYGNVVKRSLDDVEKAKEKIRGDLKQNADDVEHVRQAVLTSGPTLNQTLNTAQLLHFHGIGMEHRADEAVYPGLKELWEHLRQFMRGERPANQPRGIVIAMKYKAQFMEQLVQMLKEFQTALTQQGFTSSEMDGYNTFITDIEKVAAHIHLADRKTKSGQTSSRTTFSDQQITDIEWFITRLKQFFKFLILSTSMKRLGKSDGAVQKCRNALLNVVPYREQTMGEVKGYLTTMQNLCTIPGLGITDEERKQITKAINLSKGHWFKCPKGHVYAIGECGGANQSSKCPECGAAIGGMNHNLAQGNDVATVMDGARYGAFSDAANLENYGEDELRRIAGL